LPESGRQLGVGVIRARESSARQKRIRVNGNKSLTESVDADIRVSLLALKGCAE
jgi:hypothetical protein